MNPTLADQATTDLVNCPDREYNEVMAGRMRSAMREMALMWRRTNDNDSLMWAKILRRHAQIFERRIA